MQAKHSDHAVDNWLKPVLTNELIDLVAGELPSSNNGADWAYAHGPKPSLIN